MGFNAGDGIHFYATPESRTLEIVNVTSHSNMGVPGRFVFEVDQTEIVDVKCTDSGKDIVLISLYNITCNITCITCNICGELCIQQSVCGPTQMKTCPRVTSKHALVLPVFARDCILYTGVLYKWV